MIKAFIIWLASLLGFVPMSLGTVPVSVPSATGNGYILTSTTTGAWIASSTSNLTVGHITATTTDRSVLVGGIITDEIRSPDGTVGSASNLSLYGGNAVTGDFLGGSVYIYGGEGFGSGADGDVILGNPGYVGIQKLSSGIEALFNAERLSADRIFSFPNWAGEFVISTSTTQVSSITATSTDTSTFQGNISIGGRTITGNFYPSFTYATTSWMGTTTIPLGTAYVAETWTGVQCFTDSGVLDISINDGTNRMNYFTASTTVGTVTLSVNNTFTAGEKRYVDIGSTTPATRISCTIKKNF